MTASSKIASRLISVQETIRTLENKYHRPQNSVELLAVSKTKPIEDILAAAESGQSHFGENYVQEGVSKTQTIQ